MFFYKKIDDYKKRFNNWWKIQSLDFKFYTKYALAFSIILNFGGAIGILFFMMFGVPLLGVWFFSRKI